MKVGFIGLGRMGKHMATNVVKAGFETYVNDLMPALVEQLVSLGAKHCPTNQALAAEVDVAFTMLPNGAIVESVMCGPEGVLAACKPGTVIVDMSSVAPATTQKMAKIAAEKGVKYMDAPVSGGTAGAEAGTLTIMVGAEDETFARVEPVLQAIGKRIHHIGGVGMGDAMKIVNNMLLGSSGNSYALTAKMQKFIMADAFEPGFAMDVQYKDLTLAQEASRTLQVPIPMSNACMAVYEQARAAGLGGEDMSAVIKIWEKLCGVEIRGKKD